MSQADNLFEAPEPIPAVNAVRLDRNDSTPTPFYCDHGISSEHQPGVKLSPFTITPSSDSGSAVALHIQPELLVPRSRLPLYCLDLYNSTTLLPEGQLFSAHIEAFENRSSFQDGVFVLIVRIEHSDSLYAIERVYERVYAICKLQSWMEVSHFSRISDKKRKHGWRAREGHRAEQGQWWDNLLLQDITKQPTKKSKVCHDINTNSQRAPNPSESEIDTHISIPPPPLPPPHLLPANPQDITVAGTNTNETLSMVDDAHTNIVQHYLETLYLSKAPLTYFAKGPLSRARAKVSSEADNSIEYKLALAGRLRSMVPSVNVIDKKYRDTLPQLIKSLSEAEIAQPDREERNTVTRRRKHKPKKMKLGKNGLISTEEDYVSQWWALDISNNAAVSSAKDIDVSIKRQLAVLRFRDNLLQIILSLEVLALEESAGSGDLGAQTIESSHGNKIPETRKGPRSRKTQDLKSYLDVLVDRLCIWQSTNVIEPLNVAKDELRTESTANTQLEPGGGTDRLKEFCVDVVVPFYTGRLPNVVEQLGRTLGIKLGPSPSKRSLGNQARESRNPVPGTETLRKVPSSIQKQTKRVASGKVSKPGVATLSRSSTDPLLQDMKRERSSTPQIPLTLKSDRRPFSRANSMSQSRNFTQREVDFSAINKYNESKSKKKGKVEQELQEAITALKKPNRLSAVKDYFDEKERRTSLPPAKQGLNLQRRSTLDVQVGATPKKGMKTVQEPNDMLKTATTPADNEDFAIPSTSSNVPQSDLRSQPSRLAPDSAARLGSQDVDSNRPPVCETPSKPSRFLNPVSEAHKVVLGSSPLQASPHGNSHTVSSTLPALRALKDSTNTDFSKVISTPVKKTSTGRINAREIFEDSTTLIPKLSGQQPGVTEERAVDLPEPRRVEQSIYNRLGWSEDDLDELL